MTLDIDRPEYEVALCIGFLRGLAIRGSGRPLEEHDIAIIKKFSIALHEAYERHCMKSLNANPEEAPNDKPTVGPEELPI